MDPRATPDDEKPTRRLPPGRFDVFVSYAREDQPFVRELSGALARAGRKAWVDWADIPPTAEWMQEIGAAIESADNYLVVLSPGWVRSRVCAAELAQASQAHKRIIPLLIRTVSPADVPPDVAKLNWIEFGPDFDEPLQRLMHALDADLEHVKAHTRWLTRSLEWAAKGEDKAHLLRGGELAEAERWLSSAEHKIPAPTSLQTRFVLESRHAVTRRQRGAISVTLGLALVASALGVVALVQRNDAVHQRQLAEAQARVATSRALAAQALSDQSSNLDLALLLGAEAWQIGHTDEARAALMSVVQQSPQLSTFLNPPATASSEDRSTGQFSVAISSDGSTLAAWTSHGLVVWNLSSGEPERELPIPDGAEISSLAFSPDGSRLAGALGSAGLRVWNIATGGLSVDLPRSEVGVVTSVAFSPAGPTLAFARGSRGIGFWNLTTGTLLPDAPRKKIGWVAAVTFNPDGSRLTVMSPDHLSLWDISRGQRLGKREAVVHTSAYGVWYSPDGASLAVLAEGVGVHDRLVLRDAKSLARLGEPINVPKDDYDESSVAFSPDGATLAVAGTDGVTLWDVATGRPAGSPLPDPFHVPHPTAFSPSAVAFAPDATTLASVHGGGVVLWNLALRGPLSTTVKAGGRNVTDLAFSPDGSTLAVGGNTVTLWDTTQGDRIRRLPVQTATFLGRGVAFSPDGTTLAVGGERVTLWSVASGERVAGPLTTDLRWADNVSFSPDGSQLAAGGYDGAVVWNIADVNQPSVSLSIHRSGGGGVAFSPDGSHLAYAGVKGNVMLWDLSGRRPAGDLSGGHLVVAHSVAFSPDGRSLAAVGRGGLTVWNVATGRVITEQLGGGSDGSFAVGFDGEGSTLAFPGAGVSLLDLDTLRLTGSVTASYPWSVALSSDGSMLAISQSRPTVTLVDLMPEAWVARACAVANRTLTVDEWRQFVGALDYEPACTSS
jgi:WD40 repeat protein